MHTCYQVVLIAEDGEYPQQDFQTHDAAYNYIIKTMLEMGEGQNLVIRQIHRSF